MSSEELATRAAGDRESVVAAQIAITMRGSKGVVFAILGAIMLAGVAGPMLDGAVRRAFMLGWVGVIVGSALTTLWLFVASDRGRLSAAQWHRAGRRMTAISILYSTAWGCCTWIFVPSADSSLTAPIAIAVTLVLASSSTAAMYRPTHVALLVPTAALAAAGLARFGEPVGLALAVGICIVAAAVWQFGSILHAAVTENITMRMHSDNLLARMAEQQQITDAALQRAEASHLAAEAANRSKSAFLAAAGHDLRQPMHALVQYVGHLQRINQDARLDDTVVRIGRSLDSMQNLLDSILDISKLMMGAVRPQVSNFRLGDLLDGLDAQMRPIASGKGLQLRFDLTDVWVETDRVLLERVLRNLVLNAIRYTASGRVQIRCRRRHGVVRMAVCDTGIGIPRDLQTKVFEEFFQVDNAARDSRRGLGLGLSLVSQLCVLLGLRLRLRSRPGVGSVFFVDAPLGRQMLRPVAAAIALQQDRVRGAFIVLIDDNPASLEATSLTLSMFGCRVLAVASGTEALDRLQHQEQVPHLVISDYRLAHGETGIDAVRMVVDNQRQLVGDDIEIPALIVSGDTSPVEMAQVRDAGLRMLHKPVGVEALYSEINALLMRLARPAQG